MHSDTTAALPSAPVQTVADAPNLPTRLRASLARGEGELFLFSDPLLAGRFEWIARKACKGIPDVNDAHAEIAQQARLSLLLEDVRRRGLLAEWAELDDDIAVLRCACGAWRTVLGSAVYYVVRQDLRQPRGTADTTAAVAATPPVLMLEVVRAAVDLLDEPWRTVVARRFLGEQSCEQIAEETGISKRSAHRLVSEARPILCDIVTALVVALQARWQFDLH